MHHISGSGDCYRCYRYNSYLPRKAINVSMGRRKLISEGSLFTLWAHASTSAAALLARVPAYCLHGSQFCKRWANARQSTDIMLLAMGPCEGLGIGAYRLLWASPSSLARAANSHHGPMRWYCTLAYCSQGGPMLVDRLNIAALAMGLCEGLGREAIDYCGPARAHQQGLAYSHYGPMWAFRSAAVPPAAIVWQPVLQMMGQC